MIKEIFIIFFSHVLDVWYYIVVGGDLVQKVPETNHSKYQAVVIYDRQQISTSTIQELSLIYLFPNLHFNFFLWKLFLKLFFDRSILKTMSLISALKFSGSPTETESPDIKANGEFSSLFKCRTFLYWNYELLSTTIISVILCVL